MSEDAASAKVRALQRQRERWMAERAAAQEREAGGHSSSVQHSQQSLQTTVAATYANAPMSQHPSRPRSASGSKVSAQARSNSGSSGTNVQPNARYAAYAAGLNRPEQSSFGSPVSDRALQQSQTLGSLSLGYASPQQKAHNPYSVPFEPQPIPPSSSVSLDPIAVRAEYEPRPEVVIDRLTERIAARLREEIKEELAREGRDMMKHREELNGRVEKFLDSEAENHSCSICYQLMVPPSHGPIILYPCGHTFCTACIHLHVEVNKKNICPYCRKEIISHAPNLSLKIIIDQFIAKREKFRHGKMLPEIANQSFVDGDQKYMLGNGPEQEQTEIFLKQHQITSMRHQILTNELQDTSNELSNLDKQLSTSDVVLTHLKKERTGLEELVRQISAEVEVMKAQELEQEKKQQTLTKQKKETETKIELIKEALQPLEQQMEKARIIIENMPR